MLNLSLWGGGGEILACHVFFCSYNIQSRSLLQECATATEYKKQTFLPHAAFLSTHPLISMVVKQCEGLSPQLLQGVLLCSQFAKANQHGTWSYEFAQSIISWPRVAGTGFRVDRNHFRRNNVVNSSGEGGVKFAIIGEKRQDRLQSGPCLFIAIVLLHESITIGSIN